MFLQKWISNPHGLPQNRSLETVPVCIDWQRFPHGNAVCIHMYGLKTKKIKRHYRLSQAFVHFLIDRASFFTEHKVSSLSIRAQHKHFRTI